ncbi:MAG: hypothetical protein IT370_31995 [Deltaproteobacteria bacterium]|nr:hypothetical protein [Deltaproteobacteria bacterium]
MRPFVSIFTIIIVAAASAGCMPTGRQVVARRNLGSSERREGICVPRGHARTGVEVLGDGGIRVAVTVPCRQIYTTTARSRERIVEHSSSNDTANMLMGGGAAVIGAGGLIGLGSAMSELGRGWGSGEGCSDGCDDGHESSSAGTITALVGAGMVVGGLVVAIASNDHDEVIERNQVIDRRIVIESTPGTQPVVVRAPVGPALRVELDDAGRGLLRLPASALAETDRALLASILAQPWTLVIEGRAGTWTPTAAQVQRLLGAAPVATGRNAGRGAL